MISLHFSKLEHVLRFKREVQKVVRREQNISI